VELDLEGLLRMDSATRYKAHSDGIAGGWLAPNEARECEDLPPIPGGETPYLQQQNYSLAALAKRDNKTEDANANVQAQAMNGAQVTSLQAFLTAVSQGDLPPETARAAIVAAFPLLSAAQVDAMIAPLEEFEPAGLPAAPGGAPGGAPAPTPAPEPGDAPGASPAAEADPGADGPTDPAQDPGEDAADSAKALIEYLARSFEQALAA
jgi:hypothetical protein